MRLAPGNDTLSLGILSEILPWFPTSPASHWPGCFICGTGFVGGFSPAG